MPGLVGKATIQTSAQEERLTIPQVAVHSDGLQPYVFVEEASTRYSAQYQKKYVKLGQRKLSDASASSSTSNSMMEVLQADVFPGDRVVVKGGHELSSLFFLGVLKLADADQRRLGIVTTPAAYREIAQTTQVPATVTLPQGNRSVISSQLEGTVYSHTLSPGAKCARATC